MIDKKELCVTMNKNEKKNHDIVIVGLGLMGASLACDLKKKVGKSRIVALSRSQAKIRKALKEGIIGRGTTKVKTAFAHARMIVIATPVRTITHFVDLAEQYAPRGVIVTDVGSTKKNIVAWADKRNFSAVTFIGSHPLAGSDKGGMENAIAGLYNDEVCFITPGRTSPAEKVRAVARLWKSVGARVIMMDAAMHDRLLAASSHFPHVLAFALLNATKRNSRQALSFVGNGFKDTTRIGASAADIWCDIIVSNKENILRENREMIVELKRVQTIIARGDTIKLKRYLSEAKKVRDALS
jgi:prephenate dehydrogenase